MPDPPAPATYGFIGVGTMSSAIVRGLCTLPQPPKAVVLSPRGESNGLSLVQQFSTGDTPGIVRRAKTNQEVVDESDVIFVGVLPQQTEEVLRALTFKPTQTIVSLVSTAPLSMLQDACMPVPAAELSLIHI